LIALMTLMRSTPYGLGKHTPLVKEGQDRGAIAVLHDLAGLALQGTVQDRSGNLSPPPKTPFFEAGGNFSRGKKKLDDRFLLSH